MRVGHFECVELPDDIDLPLHTRICNLHCSTLDLGGSNPVVRKALIGVSSAGRALW